MPYKFYHGRTGKVFNVTKRAVGVVVNKQIRSVHVMKKLPTIGQLGVFALQSCKKSSWLVAHL